MNNKQLTYYSINQIAKENILTRKQITNKVKKYYLQYRLTNLIKKENNTYLIAKQLKQKMYDNHPTIKTFTINTNLRADDSSQLDEVIRTIFNNNPITQVTYTIETSSLNRLHAHGSILKSEYTMFNNCISLLFQTPYSKDMYDKENWNAYISKDRQPTYLIK